MPRAGPSQRTTEPADEGDVGGEGEGDQEDHRDGGRDRRVVEPDDQVGGEEEGEGGEEEGRPGDAHGRGRGAAGIKVDRIAVPRSPPATPRSAPRRHSRPGSAPPLRR